MTLRVFLSSVQKELASERAALRDFLRGDALMRRFFEPFLFEEVPAADRRADALYLEEVERCDLYIGLFGSDYGFEDPVGVSRDGFVTILRRRTPEVTPEVAPEVAPELRLARVLTGEMTRRELQQALDLRDDEHFRLAYLAPAFAAGLIEMTIPEKPTSRLQRYRLTAKGRAARDSSKEDGA